MPDNIQAMIDAAVRRGEPRVTISPGEHITGTFYLQSNMEFNIPAGSAILGSRDINDYPRDFNDVVEQQHHSPALIVAEDKENITISGYGVVDGRGSTEFFPAVRAGDEMDRPMLLRFNNCRNIYLRDIQFKNSASWGLHFINCENVHINGISIDSMLNRNNDGLDLDGCRDVFISNCRLRTGDDAICPKSTLRSTENVVITNCIVTSDTAAFKLGTSSAGGFRNITLSNCIFRDCRMGAIKLLCVDGGILENVLISDVVMDNVEGPIFIRLGSRGIKYSDQNHAEKLIYSFSNDLADGTANAGILRNVTIRNVRACVGSNDRKRWGIMITGIPGHYVENVLLSDIEISFPGGGTAQEAGAIVMEDETRYPEQYFFGVLPSWGAFIRHARRIEFRNVLLHTRAPDQRDMIFLDDVSDSCIHEGVPGLAKQDVAALIEGV